MASEDVQNGCLTLIGVVALLTIVGGGCYAYPKYNVYQQEAAGHAKLAEAESSRQIAVLEAKAKMEAATMLGNAEVARAKGVAEANKIIGDSLKNNDAYLRYLWITEMKSDRETIYIPTEAGIPILEAGKRKQLPAPPESESAN